MEIVFRSPSEHTKEGERYDLEMQIIHKIKVLALVSGLGRVRRER